jgi:hypothetical protein
LRPKVRAVSTIARIVHHLPVESASDVAEHAAGRGELDHVGACRNLLAHGAAAVVGAVAHVGHGGADRVLESTVDAVDRETVPGGDRDARTRRDDGRTGEASGVDRVAKRSDHARSAAEIPNGGKARQQRLPGIQQPGIGGVFVIERVLQQPRLKPVVHAAQVHVHVDEAGEHRAVAKIDDPGAGHVDEAVAHGGDLLPLHDHADLASRRAAGDCEQSSGVDHDRLLNGRCGGRPRLGLHGDWRRHCKGKCGQHAQTFHKSSPVIVERRKGHAARQFNCFSRRPLPRRGSGDRLGRPPTSR